VCLVYKHCQKNCELMLQTVTDLYKSRGFKAVHDPLLAMTRNVSALSLTVRRDVAQLIPVQDVGKLSLREFAKIYTVRMRLHCIVCHEHPVIPVSFQRQHANTASIHAL